MNRDSGPLAPAIVDGQSWPRHGYVSPLQPFPGEGRYPTSLRGGVVTDPQRVAEIRARVAYARLPWWRRWLAPRPTGYRSATVDAFVEALLLADGDGSSR